MSAKIAINNITKNSGIKNPFDSNLIHSDSGQKFKNSLNSISKIYTDLQTIQAESSARQPYSFQDTVANNLQNSIRNIHSTGSSIDSTIRSEEPDSLALTTSLHNLELEVRMLSTYAHKISESIKTLLNTPV